MCLHGHEVFVQQKAGEGSGFSDEEYVEAGARILPSIEEIYEVADMIVKVKEPIEQEYKLVRKGQLVFTYFHFASEKELTEAMLKSFGYDIVTFSNHNELTDHPTDKALQVNLYEHGYNLLKFHKLVFGAEKVWRFDHLLPIFASQKQFQIAQLSQDADIVQLNHPLRTPTLTKSQLQRLSGYKLIELDSGKSIILYLPP